MYNEGVFCIEPSLSEIVTLLQSRSGLRIELINLHTSPFKNPPYTIPTQVNKILVLSHYLPLRIIRPRMKRI